MSVWWVGGIFQMLKWDKTIVGSGGKVVSEIEMTSLI